MSEAQAVPPRFLFKLAIWLSATLEWLLNLITPPSAKVTKAAQGFMESGLVFAFCKLNIPEAITDQWQSTASVAARAGVDEDVLERLLKGLNQMGFLELRGTASRFEVKHNRFSALLKGNCAGSMKPIMTHFQQDMWVPWGRMDEAVKTCNQTNVPSMWAEVHGSEFWEFMASNPKRNQDFSQAMKAVDTLGLGAVLADHNWSQYSRILDIGGATGSVVSEILNTTNCQGIVCDLKHVIEDAKQKWAERKNAGDPLALKVDNRLNFEVIDFLKKGSIPSAKDGDAYLTRNICHDWPDKDCIEILKNVRSAIGNAKATFVLLEMSNLSLARNPIHLTSTMIDLHMIVAFKGKERNELQWKELLAKTGFELVSCIQARAPFVVWVAKPIS